MINPQHTLELIYDNVVIYSSNKSRLRPLMEAILVIEEKYSSYKELKLNDKTIGLAAAKLIIYNGKIHEIHTEIASKNAVELLSKHNISIYAKKIVDKILNEDKSAQCPMEIKSENLTPEEFYNEFKKILNL